MCVCLCESMLFQTHTVLFFGCSFSYSKRFGWLFSLQNLSIHPQTYKCWELWLSGKHTYRHINCGSDASDMGLGLSCCLCAVGFGALQPCGAALICGGRPNSQAHTPSVLQQNSHTLTLIPYVVRGHENMINLL